MITKTSPLLGRRPGAVGIWRQYKDGHLVPKGGRSWETVNGVFINLGSWHWNKRRGFCLWIGRRS